MMNRQLFAVTFALGSLLTVSPPAVADENAQLHGKTISQWSARWWQWQEEYYPGFSFGEGLVDCSLGQTGRVWFLGGTVAEPVERICSEPIKGHKHLMFPLVNAALSNPFEGEDLSIEEKRELLDGIFSEDPAGIFNSAACSLQATVDDIPAVFDAPIVRTQSPPFERGDDPEAIADGFWVVLPPLASGEHTIRFTGGLCNTDTGEPFFGGVDTVYTLEFKDDDEDDDEDDDDD